MYGDSTFDWLSGTVCDSLKMVQCRSKFLLQRNQEANGPAFGQISRECVVIDRSA